MTRSLLKAHPRTRWGAILAGQRGVPLLPGAVLLLALTMLAYLPALRAGFIWDDDDHVTQNRTLRTLDGLEQIWFQPHSLPQYYPLTHTSFWLEYHLWGLHPLGYHLDNVLLHALNALLLWRLLRWLRVPGAWWAALIFALHPVYVESVAWVTERKNVLSGLFYLLAGFLFLSYEEGRGDAETRRRGEKAKGEHANPGAPGNIEHSTSNEIGEGMAAAPVSASPRLRVSASFLLFIMALLSKTVTASLPAALLLVIWWRRGKLRWRDVWPLVPFFAAGLALGLMTAVLEKQQVGATGPEWDFSLLQRVLIAGRAAWFYAGKLLWPHPLIFIYPRWRLDSPLWQQALFPLGVLAVVALLWVQRRRWGRGPLAAVLFFLGTLFPALGFINVFPMRYTFVADHYQYLASIGLIVPLAGLFFFKERQGDKGTRGQGDGKTETGIRGRFPLSPCLLVPLFFLIFILTWRRAHVYADAQSVWQDTLAKDPDCWMGQANYGTVLLNQAMQTPAGPERQSLLEDAAEHFRAAGRLRPLDAEPPMSLGRLLAEEGRLAEASEQYQQALRLNPALVGAHVELGNLLLRQGNVEQAIVHWQVAIKGKADDLGLRNQLAILLAQHNRLEEAAEQLRYILQRQPGQAAVHNNLGMVLAAQGKRDEAILHYQKALEIRPDFAEAKRNLAKALFFNEGQGDKETRRQGEDTGYRGPPAPSHQ